MKKSGLVGQLMAKQMKADSRRRVTDSSRREAMVADALNRVQVSAYMNAKSSEIKRVETSDAYKKVFVHAFRKAMG